MGCPSANKCQSGLANVVSSSLLTCAASSQVKTSALDGVVLKLPSEPTRDPVATFKPKKGTAEYDVFVVPADEHKAGQKRRRDDDDEEEKLGGEEMQSLVPLLPCKSRGDKLFQGERCSRRCISHSH